MARPAYRIRNLQAFLARVESGWLTYSWGFFVFLFVGSPLGVVAFINLLNGGPLFWPALVAFAGLTAICARMEVKARQKLISLSSLSIEGRTALREFCSLNGDGSLEERLDADAAAMLDNCTALFQEIDSIFEQPNWRDAEGQRRVAKTSVKAALMSLIDDAFVIATTGLRSKGMRKDSFAKRMNDPAVREPMLESLDRVRAGIESLRTELGNSSLASTSPESDLETALAKLTEIRQAEEELREHHRG
jgi:hypothetical protein